MPKKTGPSELQPISGHPVLAWLRAALIVDDHNPALLQAQFRALITHAPLLHLAFFSGMWLLALTYSGYAPLWLTLYFPLALSVAAVLRALHWWRVRNTVPRTAQALRAVRQTMLALWVLTPLCILWVVLLHGYGDVYLRAHGIFFLSLTTICVLFCMAPIRQAVLASTVITLCMCALLLWLTPELRSLPAILFNVALITLTLLWLLLHQYSALVELIRTRQQAEALSKENLLQAHRDTLTLLPNRRVFFMDLDEHCARAARSKASFGLAILDLDGFKPVNNLHGHMMGDQLLLQVSQRLTALCKGKAWLARLGGDEFALIIREMPAEEDYLTFGQQVCTDLALPYVIGDISVQITASIGLVIYPHLASDAQALHQCADYALCQGKRQQRGTVTLFSHQHRDRIQRDALIQQTLRTADLEAELSIQFQPIVDATLGRTSGFEALARWQSPTLGFVPPGEFIPVAERSGLIQRLTEVLLRKALVHASTWPQGLRLAFNLSAHDLEADGEIRRLLQQLHNSGIQPAYFDLELTETAATQDVQQMLRIIGQLRSQGFGVALDDLGSGFSTLSQLLSLPLTKIKIDRSFVMGIDQNPTSRKIVAALLTLSRDMGLDCVLEGVETNAERRTLLDLGATLMQGYIYSRPMPAQNIAHWLQTCPPVDFAANADPLTAPPAPNVMPAVHSVLPRDASPDGTLT